MSCRETNHQYGPPDTFIRGLIPSEAYRTVKTVADNLTIVSNAAELVDVITTDLKTRAASILAQVPSPINSITTIGFNNPGDLGGATYVRASGPFTDGSSFQSADGAWWKFTEEAPRPNQFGAIGTITNSGTLTDETSAIQLWINYLKANGLPGYVPPRTYYHTKSLNWGKSNPNDQIILRIIGLVSGYSRFVSGLTEAYPAHDFTNQKFAKISDLYFYSTSGSLHTCMMLLAETQGSGVNLFQIESCTFNDIGSASKYAIFGYCADQVTIINSNISGWSPIGSAGAAFSNKNPNSIVSKYYAIYTTDADSTVLNVMFSEFECLTGPGLLTDGVSGVNLFSVYAGTTNNGDTTLGHGHTQGMFRFKSGTNNSDSSTRQCHLNMQGCRTEDNTTPGATPLVTITGSISPATDYMTSVLTVSSVSGGTLTAGQLLTGSGVPSGVVVIAQLTDTTWSVSNLATVSSTTIKAFQLSGPAIYVDDYLYESIINGIFGTSGAGSIGGPGIHQNSNIAISSSYAGFHNAGGIIGGTIHLSGGNNRGGSFTQSASRGYRIGGRLGDTEVAVIAAYGPSAGEITDLGLDYNTGYEPRRNLNARVFADTGNTNAPVNFGTGWRGNSSIFNLVYTYTGGSGLAQIGSTANFNPAPLHYEGVSESELELPYATFTLQGSFNPTWAASGEMKFVLQQTVSGVVKTATLIDATDIPAYSQVTGWELVVQLYGYSSSGLYAFTTLKLKAASASQASIDIYGGRTDLGTAGFSATAGICNILHSISNAGSNPITPFQAYKFASA